MVVHVYSIENYDVVESWRILGAQSTLVQPLKLDMCTASSAHGPREYLLLEQ